MAKQYWWISVGGNDYGPAVIIDRKQVFTFGCRDAFDVGDAGIRLVKEMQDAPATPEQAAKMAEARERKRVQDRKLGTFHGYRRF